VQGLTFTVTVASAFRDPAIQGSYRSFRIEWRDGRN